MARAVERFGRIDVLVNNAGFGIQVCAVCPGSFRTDFRDATSMHHPATPISAYDDSPAHKAAQYLAENNHKQAGDPAKAARFVADIVETGKLPKRMLIGGLCCQQACDDLDYAA